MRDDVGDEIGTEVEDRRAGRDGRWMMMWLFSIAVGGAYGFGLVWSAVLYVGSRPDGDGLTMSTARYAGRSVAFGLFYATAGAVCGLVVALVLTFLVRGGTGPRARRAAQLVGASTHAVVALLLLVLLGGGFGMFLWVVVASGLVGLVAGWWHDRLASRPRVEDFYAH